MNILGLVPSLSPVAVQTSPSRTAFPEEVSFLSPNTSQPPPLYWSPRLSGGKHSHVCSSSVLHPGTHAPRTGVGVCLIQAMTPAPSAVPDHTAGTPPASVGRPGRGIPRGEHIRRDPPLLAAGQRSPSHLKRSTRESVRREAGPKSSSCWWSPGLLAPRRCCGDSALWEDPGLSEGRGSLGAGREGQEFCRGRPAGSVRGACGS